MPKKERQVKESYILDRLWEQKLSQAYHLLIPPTDNNNVSPEQPNVELNEDSAYENSSNIYPGIIHATER